MPEEKPKINTQNLEKENACRDELVKVLEKHNCYVDVAITISTDLSIKGEWVIKSRAKTK